MMASTSFAFPFNSGRSPLDLPVAALAGFSVAFLAFAAPADTLAQLVAATGLPGILPAAQPPLGMTARIALGVAGAVTMFALSFLLLRWLDRFAAQPRPRSVDPRPFESHTVEPHDDIDIEAPRQRRRDAHPDAPPRPPILAARDLGEPAPPNWSAIAATPVEPAPAPAPEPVAEATSITDLMARLERGLARRAGAATTRPHAAPQVFPEPTDDRLQSALDGLQRLASRRD